jgi:hypothetical protein
MKLYRYSNSLYDSPTPKIHEIGVCVVFIHEIDVVKSTPCGSWIVHRQGKKWINHERHKQFAYKTMEEAKAGFIARKKRQIHILTSQLQNAKESLLAIETPTKDSIDYNYDHLYVFL